jgi:hypothetical protein
MTTEQEEQPTLTPDELNLITFLEQQYRITGRLLSADQAFNEFAIPERTYRQALSKTQVREALAERGVVFERFNDDWTAHALTPIQSLVANSVLDLTDTRTTKKKLQDLGVSTRTYDAWMKDPVFKSYMHTRAEQMLGEGQHDAATALLDKVRSGDIKAIEYYNELTGRYVRPRAGQNVDITQLIAKIVEIIDEEVDDPDTLRRLSLRIRGAISARNTANALLGHDEDAIVVPQVVKASAIELESSSDNVPGNVNTGAGGL